MLKRILVAMDRDDGNAVETSYAQMIGGRCRAEITGLTVVNSQMPRSASVAGPATGAGQVAELDVELVSYGVPCKRIGEELKYHDLLVIGREPHFSGSKQKSNTLARIVKQSIAPSLVAPEAYRDVVRVLVAYDGSDPAARTMQKFAQLQPFGTDVAIEIVHVRGWVGDHFTRRSESQLTRAGEFLRAHGFQTVHTMSLELADPSVRVLEYALETEADLIVAGAHSVSAMYRITFGSTTHALLAACPVPFFLFH